MRGYAAITIVAMCIIVTADTAPAGPGLLKSEGFLPMSRELIKRIEELELRFDTVSYTDERPMLTQRVVSASFMESIHVSPHYQCRLIAPLSQLAEEILKFGLNNGDQKEVTAIVALITSPKIVKRVTKMMPKNPDTLTLFKYLGCLYQDVLQTGLLDAVPQLEIPNTVQLKSRCRSENLPTIAEEGCNILRQFEVDDDRLAKRFVCGGVCVIVGTLITSVVASVVSAESSRASNAASIQMERQRLEMDRVRFLADHGAAQFAHHELRYQERLPEDRLPLNFLDKYETDAPNYYLSADPNTTKFKRETDLHARLIVKITKVHQQALAGHRKGGLFLFVLGKLNFPLRFAEALGQSLLEESKKHLARYDPDGLGQGDNLLMRGSFIDQSRKGVPYIKGCLGLCDPMLSEISSWRDKTVTAVGHTKHPTNSQKVTVEEDATLKYQFGLVLAMPEQFENLLKVPFDYLNY